MTTPPVQPLPAGGTALRRTLGLAAVSAALIGLLFLAGAVVGVLLARKYAALGILLAVAYLAGLVLAIGVWSTARAARRAVSLDGLRISAARRARAAAYRYTRLCRIAAASVAVLAIVFAFQQGDASWVFLGVLCAAPLISLASVAQGVTRRLARHLPGY
jgi:hypothetical protein